MSKQRPIKQPYRLSFTVKELQDKEYHKYLYPQEIDGITFKDDVERKLSESSWFRCLEPKRQLILEKEIRLRASGEFNHKFLHYEDSEHEAALSIAKPVMMRLVESLTRPQLWFFLYITPYIHINDGILRNKNRELFTIAKLAELVNRNYATIFYFLRKLEAKKVIFVARTKIVPSNKNDIYLPIAERLSDDLKRAEKVFSELVIYVNPYIVFFGQYIDKYVMPFFNDSAWFVLNPYAEQIKDWVQHHCR